MFLYIQCFFFFYPCVCWSGKHTVLVVMPLLLHHQLNLELRHLHVKVLLKSIVLQSTIVWKLSQINCASVNHCVKIIPNQTKFLQYSHHFIRTKNWGSVIIFRQIFEQKAVFPVRANTNTQRGKQTDLGERWFKRGEKPESWCSFWPLIPLLRKLKKERWASAELGFTSPSPLPSLRGVGVSIHRLF